MTSESERDLKWEWSDCFGGRVVISPNMTKTNLFNVSADPTDDDATTISYH